jgi:hypothetical protein
MTIYFPPYWSRDDCLCFISRTAAAHRCYDWSLARDGASVDFYLR